MHEQLTCTTTSAGRKRLRDPTVLGRTEHVAVWLYALIAIQDRMHEDLDWKADCGILIGLRDEMRATGWKPINLSTLKSEHKKINQHLASS